MWEGNGVVIRKKIEIMVGKESRYCSED